MAKKKRYQIYCNTEGGPQSGWTNLDTPPATCPNNVAHSVKTDSLSVEEVLALNNLTATTDPTVNDDIDDGYAAGSVWLNTTTGVSFVCVDNTAGAAAWTRQLTGVFGTELNYAESLTEASTTDFNNWIDKLELEVSNLPAGTYRIGWSSGVKSSSGSKSYQARCLLDDATDLGFVQNYNPDYLVFAGFALKTLTAGNHVVCLEFKCTSGAMTVYMRNARIELWRIS